MKTATKLLKNDSRQWKKEAHKYFDIIWKEKHEKRYNVYTYLSEHLGLPVNDTHIRKFSVETCKEVVDWSKMILNDLRRLDMDFGIDVKRQHYDRNS